MKKNYSTLAPTLTLVTFFLSGLMFADTLELKNGTLIEGTYLGGTQNSIRMQVEGEVKTYQVSEVLALTFTGTAVSAPAAAPAAQAPPAQQPASAVTVPSGTPLLVRMGETLDSKKHKAGHRFTASLEGDLVAGGVVVAPKGSTVYGVLTEAKKSGRVAGKSEMKIELTGIMINNQMHPIATGNVQAKTEGTGKSTVKRTAKAAAIGGLIKGSSGAKTGAKVGAGVSILTKGNQINIPKETLLEFILRVPLTL